VSSDSIIKFTDTYTKNPKTINICSQACVDDYCKTQEIKKQNNEDYIELLKYIYEVHETTFIPNLFHIKLRDLNNGVTRNGKNIVVKGKGVDWNELLIAYKYSASTIQKIKLTKSFDSISNELMYCLSIVKNNFFKAIQTNKQEQLNKNININIPVNESEEYKYKKQVFDDDISDIL